MRSNKEVHFHSEDCQTQEQVPREASTLGAHLNFENQGPDQLDLIGSASRGQDAIQQFLPTKIILVPMNVFLNLFPLAALKLCYFIGPR